MVVTDRCGNLTKAATFIEVPRYRTHLTATWSAPLVEHLGQNFEGPTLRLIRMSAEGYESKGVYLA